MEKSEYRNIYENEEIHFFYVSTHRLVINLIKKWTKKKSLTILDAGCGTGGLAKKLTVLGNVAAVDASPEAIKFSKKRGVVAKLSPIEKIPYPNGTFDVVTCIDVIYHKQIKDDVEALSEIRRVLKPRGVLVLRVPANRYLLSAHDRHVHTARRYSKKELDRKLRQAGFVVKYISFVHSPIFLVSLMRLIAERLTHLPTASAVGKVNPIVNKFLSALLKLESKMIVAGITIPFGQGLIAVARRQPIKRPPAKRAVSITPRTTVAG